MADTHPRSKAAPRQRLGRLQSTLGDKSPLAVGHVRLTVKNIRPIVSFGHIGQLRHSLRRPKCVTCVEKPDIVARRPLQALVHRVVQPTVRLRNGHVPHRLHATPRAFVLHLRLPTCDSLHRPVSRFPVNHEVLHFVIRLHPDTLQGPLKRLPSIICDRDDGEEEGHKGIAISTNRG